MVDSYSKVFEYVASCGGMVRSGVVDVFILRGKLWVNWLNTGYSINVGEIWGERWLENKRKMNRRLPV